MLRLLVPLIAGILIGLYYKESTRQAIVIETSLAGCYIIFCMLPLAYRFKIQPVLGIIITLFIANTGVLLAWQKDVRSQSRWYGNQYDSSSYIIATISEPPVEKNKSYKALANVDAVINKSIVHETGGKLLLYFSKDSGSGILMYGSRVIIKKELQEIKNSGNPAAFDYKGYCAARQIYYQCYLRKRDWLQLTGSNASWFKMMIYHTQHFIVSILDKYITGDDERAIAKALLIGYKVDLDKDLIQAYSNAGVIHLIIIAGLHLGLIYALLSWVTGLIPVLKRSGIFRMLLILLCLWFFAVLTGASPSVLRAVVMFTFISAGKAFNKNASVFNSLACSAFVLLLFDPYMLQDAGFQLSYLAVTSIVICYRYIYNWMYLKNTLLRKIWELAAVSLAAQVLTLPACLYYFHQVPLLFMLSNIIAIPLAAFALWGCIALVAVSPVTVVAVYAGKVISVALWLLNHAIRWINVLPFSVWDGFSISLTETCLLYSIILCLLYWLIKHKSFAFILGACGILAFSIIATVKKWDVARQRKMIVYNIPAHKAIDFVSGAQYDFVGDSDLAHDGTLQNFDLKPARTTLMVHENVDSSFPFFQHDFFCQFYNKKILLLDSAIQFKPPVQKISLDYIILSKNPKIYIPALAAAFNCSLYIFDASNPLWKIEKWKKDCEQLHLHYHSVPELGAFVTDL
jgi:competence protein ComEC